MSLSADPILRISFILLLGISFSTILIFIFERKNNGNVKNFWDSFWYTLVTLTTTGYGDISPSTILGRLVGIITMAFGVIVVAAVTGQIASFFVDQQMRRGKGLLKLKNLKGHYIICGWKKDFEKIIDGIFEANPDFDGADFVLINSVSSEYMEMFLSNPKYKMMNYIHGDYIDEEVLLKANIKTASRILILADQSSNYSEMEIDSRTVMAVLTVEKLNRSIYSAAELLDKKFENYLEIAHCDEVLLTKEYERKLIVNASSGTGVSHVIMDLLSLEDKKGIIIQDIPENFIGVSFKKLFYNVLENENNILIA
ncbi:MAG TPA: ion channel [Spirochaetota bacterium]|nr:ion channel [Spirochaetota bacterium]